ncbi:hypothetical protein HID58_084412 [Brassica napus]|uniref:Uncharacterized protein n=1 Tax=Brassica napus TaxID=3708 RepID=A0ABQ7XM39_BRANA|nr:hypothetical protein HID58_084412 [Brassica napus]
MMKTSRLIMISFLLVAITTSYGVVGEGTDVVYDADAQPVMANVPYYISFMTYDYKMWICRVNMGSNDPKSCPQQPVMITNPPADLPTQVMFLLPSSASNNTVHESTELNIKFISPGQCGESGFWRVVQNSTTLEGEVVLNGYPTTISLSNEPVGRQKLLAKRFAGVMEVYFYRNMPKEQV